MHSIILQLIKPKEWKVNWIKFRLIFLDIISSDSELKFGNWWNFFYFGFNFLFYVIIKTKLFCILKFKIYPQIEIFPCIGFFFFFIVHYTESDVIDLHTLDRKIDFHNLWTELWHFTTKSYANLWHFFCV